MISTLSTVERFTLATDERRVRTLAERLRPIALELIVLEATGGYELLAVAALAAAGLPVIVVNPRQVPDFAKLVGIASVSRDWGTLRGRRFVQGGRARSPRRALHGRHET